MVVPLFFDTPREKRVRDIFNQKRMFDDIVGYAQMGVHRTGYPGDRACSDWLADEFAAAGLEVGFHSWRLRQFMVEECSLELHGRRMAAFPYWFPRATGGQGVSGPVARLGLMADPGRAAGSIVYMDAADYQRYDENRLYARARELAASGALGLVLASTHPSGGICGVNAPHPERNQTPWPLPTVLVGYLDKYGLEIAAERADTAQLTLTGQDVPDVEARNVLGFVKRGPKVVVVSTPQSGWFTNAGERGPGLAITLALARWAGRLKKGPSFLVMSNSGHELGNLGMKDFLARGQIPATRDVVAWLHLGASIVCRDWKVRDRRLVPEGVCRFSNLNASGGLYEYVLAAFRNIGFMDPIVGPAHGELELVHKKGYDAFGFYGGHFYFHSPGDGPECVPPAELVQVARACRETLKRVVLDHQ